MDAAILDERRKAILFYSIVMDGSKFAGLVINPAFPAELLLDPKKVNSIGLRNLFEKATTPTPQGEIKIECYDELDGEEIYALLAKDLAQIPEEIKTPLLSLVRNIFK